MDMFYIHLVFFTTLTVTLATTLRTPEENRQENLEKLATANNKLALDLYRKFAAKSSENVFFSPLSLSTAFGMLYYGTDGDTAEKLRHVLGYGKTNLSEPLVHDTFHQYLIESLSSQDPSAYVLKSANSILLDKSLDLKPSYKKKVQELYLASVQDVDFVNESQKIVEDVNSWVNDNTNGKIDKLLDSVDPFTSLIILNAIYFKGAWKTQFDRRRTSSGTFYNNGLESEAKEVPMMRMRSKINYKSMPDAKVIELPYKGDNFSMMIVLPKEKGGLKNVETHLTPEDLKIARQNMYKSRMMLTLPKFKVEYSEEMSDEFQSLGADSIFSPGADFSRMTSSKNIYVSQVQHKAVVEVNEEGSEAAAATAFGKRKSGGRRFIVNYPFLFLIVDTRNDMIIFMGRVVKL